MRQLKAAGCEKILRDKIPGTTADRPQLAKLIKVLAPGDVVITPAVDRLSRDTTDLLVIAREMQRAGAGIRSLAEPYLDTTSDFAEIIFSILGMAAKIVFGVNPDSGNGSFEWLTMELTAISAVVAIFLARADWRRLRSQTRLRQPHE